MVQQWPSSEKSCLCRRMDPRRAARQHFPLWHLGARRQKRGEGRRRAPNTCTRRADVKTMPTVDDKLTVSPRHHRTDCSPQAHLPPPPLPVHHAGRRHSKVSRRDAHESRAAARSNSIPDARALASARVQQTLRRPSDEVITKSCARAIEHSPSATMITDEPWSSRGVAAMPDHLARAVQSATEKCASTRAGSQALAGKNLSHP